MAEFPMPGTEFDGGITVASGWVDDDHIGVLLIYPDRPGEFYAIGEYRLAGGSWEQTWGTVDSNIVPAARAFDDQFGFWAGT